MTQNIPTQKTEKLDRRGFLKASSVGAGAVVVAAPVATTTAEASERGAERTKARYKATPHVEKFYQTNRYPK